MRKFWFLVIVKKTQKLTEELLCKTAYHIGVFQVFLGMKLFKLQIRNYLV